MRILFIDTVCYKPYDNKTLREEPLGGTEATVVRLAEGLARRPEIEQIDVLQHNRTVSEGVNPRYTGFNEKLTASPTHIVVLRSTHFLRDIRERFPQATIYLWAHDLFQGQQWQGSFQTILDTRTLPVCVSKWHQGQMRAFAASLGFPELPSCYMYNPIDDDLVPDSTPLESDKLIFFSSPHKGLANTLAIFQQLRQMEALSHMRLFISNPGYFDDKDTRAFSNVVNLGRLSHYQALGHVRSSFAVLHLNNIYPETFGLVHAEANAVGVPFINAAMGAIPEICPDPRQFIDADDAHSVAKKLIDWQMNGRPTVQANAAFRLKEVVAEWIGMFSARTSPNSEAD